MDDDLRRIEGNFRVKISQNDLPLNALEWSMANWHKCLIVRILLIVKKFRRYSRWFSLCKFVWKQSKTFFGKRTFRLKPVSNRRNSMVILILESSLLSYRKLHQIDRIHSVNPRIYQMLKDKERFFLINKAHFPFYLRIKMNEIVD